MADLGSIAALKAANDARLPDNNTNAISEGDVRDSFTDTADTVDGLIPVSPIPPSWEMTLAAAVTPTTGQVTPNNDTASAVTTLKYYENDRGTVNRSADFALMRVGGIITNEQIAQGDGITQEDAVKFRITGAPTLASNVWTIPVAHVSGVFSGILSFWYVSYAGNLTPTLTLPWRMWGTDENFGAPTVPTTLADFFATDPYTIAFAPDANGGIRLFMQMPDNYLGGAFTVRISGPALPGSGGNAIMYANAVVTAPGNELTGSANGLTLNTGTLNLTGTADGDLYTITINVTPSGDTWAAGSMLALLVGRNAANVLDTHDESVYFTSATVTY